MHNHSANNSSNGLLKKPSGKQNHNNSDVEMIDIIEELKDPLGDDLEIKFAPKVQDEE